MKINIRNTELELRYSMRIFIIYENIMGEGIGFNNNIQSYTAALTLFYSAIISSLQHYKMNTDLSYDEFMDWIDEQNPNVLREFTDWFVNYLNVQADKVNQELAKKDSKVKVDKKKTKN